MTGETVTGICALTPDRGRAYWHDGPDDTWQDTSGNGGGPNNTPFVNLYGGEYGVVCTVSNGELWKWDWPFRNYNLDLAQRWFHIGNPGASFTVTAESVYGLTPDGARVYRYDGTPMSWTQVGTAAGQIFGGSWGLVATDPNTGDLFHYLGSPFNWEAIGLPGAAFAVTAESVYGLTPDEARVYRYDGTPMSWTQVGGPAIRLCAGPWGLVANSPNGDLYHYLGTPFDWELIGGPGDAFAVAADTVYGLTPDRGAVYRYDGTPMSWTQVGGPAAAITAADHFFNE
ncbi:hypothetical protein ACH4E8_28120 [Streptomyces sp. NPDC017979]|uniref:hypothetical protein n=1 Tax=Streptomyces sp. NPDC017979 TaxID=3365024 RepID=UPI00379A8BF2